MSIKITGKYKVLFIQTILSQHAQWQPILLQGYKFPHNGMVSKHN